MSVETWTLAEWRIVWGMLMRSRHLAHEYPLPDDSSDHAQLLDKMYRDVYGKIADLVEEEE